MPHTVDIQGLSPGYSLFPAINMFKSEKKKYKKGPGLKLQKHPPHAINGAT